MGDGRCGDRQRGRGRGGGGQHRKPINLGQVVIHLEQLLPQKKPTLIGPVAVVAALTKCQ